MHAHLQWEAQGSAHKLQETSGVADNRAVQALQPVITLSDLHKKLTVSNVREQQTDGPELYSSFHSKLGEAAKQSTLTAGIILSNAANPDVPEGLTPETWAALQKTAQQLDVKGIFDPQVNQLRSKMLQQVKLYKASQAKQQQATAAKARFNSLPGTRAPTPLAAQQTAAATLAGRLEASCQHVIASLPVQHAQRSHTAASLTSAASDVTHQTSRTNATVRIRCNRRDPQQQTLQKSVQGSNDAEQTCSPLGRPQPPPILQLQKSRRPIPTRVAVPAADEAEEIPTNETPGSPLAAAALAGLSARTSSTAEAVAAWQMQNEQLGSVSSNRNSCTCTTSCTQQQEQLHMNHLPGCPCATSSARSGTASTADRTQHSSRRQQGMSIRTIAEEPQHEQTHKGRTRRLYYSRAKQRKPDQTLAQCVAAIATEDRPSSPTDEHNDSAAAAIQRRMTPAASEAFQTAVAVAVDSKLKLYRDRAQQARQRMLQVEFPHSLSLSSEHQNQQQGQTVGSATSTSSEGQGLPACGAMGGSEGCTVGTGAGTAVPSASTAADVALLTMQQLVVLLAKRDAAPEEPDQQMDPASSAGGDQQLELPVLTKTAAASQKLEAAKTVAEIIAAANEHVNAAAHELDDPVGVNFGTVAQLAANRNMGKAWQKQPQACWTSDSIPSSIRGTSNAVPEAAGSRKTTTEIAQYPLHPASHSLTPPSQPAPGSSADVTTAVTSLSAIAAASSGAEAVGNGCNADAAANKRASSGGFAGAQVSCVGQAASRAPAGMTLPPPRLQAPSEEELEALPLPSLPDLLDLSHEPAQVLQARLDRVWEVLGVPPEQQMKMVLSYTSRATATQFDVALDTWETAAAAVLQREGILQQLQQLRATMRAVKQQKTSTNHCRLSQDAASDLLALDISQIHQLLWAFLAATEQVRLAAQQFQQVTGQPLLVNCVAYPPAGAVMSANQLQPILDEAWGLLGHDRM